MDQLICASLSYTHYWYEVGMLKVSCSPDRLLLRQTMYRIDNHRVCYWILCVKDEYRATHITQVQGVRSCRCRVLRTGLLAPYKSSSSCAQRWCVVSRMYYLVLISIISCKIKENRRWRRNIILVLSTKCRNSSKCISEMCSTRRLITNPFIVVRTGTSESNSPRYEIDSHTKERVGSGERISILHSPVLSTCLFHINSGCGKERRISIGSW